jgi:hypothetical protein
VVARVKANKKRHVTVKGRRFESITDAARFYKVNRRVANHRLNRGFPINQVFGIEPIFARSAHKKISVAGKTYKSISEAARAHNINPGTIHIRLREYKFSIEEAFEIVPRKGYEKGIIGRVYLMTNKINKKVYVGVTRGSLEKRFSHHVRNAFSKKIFDPGSISVAIKKFKPESFTIKEIDKTSELGELSIKERSWIKYFNSTKPNGYNITSGGGAPTVKGNKITVKGKRFKSITEACHHFGYKTETQRREISNRIYKGWTPDEAFNIKKRKGYKRREMKEFLLKGKSFKGYVKAKKFFKTKASINLIASRIRLSGWTLEEAFEIKERKNPRNISITFKGKKFLTAKALCDKYGVSHKNFTERRRKGWSVEKCLSKKNNNNNAIMFRGKKYDTEKSLCEDYGMNYSTYKNRRKRLNWSLEECLGLKKH